MLKTVQKYGVRLAIFSAVLTSLIAFMNELTKNTINEKWIHQKQVLFDQVIPAKFYDNNLQKSCFVVEAPELGKGAHRVFIAHKGGNPSGVIMEVTAPDGYSGSIQLLVGTDFCGTVLGTRVIEHRETPGLGDKIELRLTNWILNFSGKVIHSDDDIIFTLKKYGGEFDQFTGATITPRAVVNAVKRAGLYAKTLPAQLNILPICKE